MQFLVSVWGLGLLLVETFMAHEVRVVTYKNRGPSCLQHQKKYGQAAKDAETLESSISRCLAEKGLTWIEQKLGGEPSSWKDLKSIIFS